MRVITGSARGTKLASLEGEATRPTSDKVKEALFSMIQFDIEGRSVLDLFGGSGQLAIEALSRGAERATIIDQSRDAVNIIIENAKKTHLFEKCRVSAADYSSFIRGASGRETYDIVFLDPPYDGGFLPAAGGRRLGLGHGEEHCKNLLHFAEPRQKRMMSFPWRAYSVRFSAEMPRLWRDMRYAERQFTAERA